MPLYLLSLYNTTCFGGNVKYTVDIASHLKHLIYLSSNETHCSEIRFLVILLRCMIVFVPISQVAMAMAAKAKLLMRELKTVKADLAFAKDRCAQLEEENRMLRENREKGDDTDDDDLVSNLLLLLHVHFVGCLCQFPKHPD